MLFRSTVIWLFIIIWAAPTYGALAQLPPHDFSDIDFQKKSISLKGPWEFYWQSHLKPAEPLPPPSAIATVGEDWRDIKLANGQQAGAFGYATYRLRFTGLPRRAFGYEIGLAEFDSPMKMILYREDQPNQLWQVGEDIAATEADAKISRNIRIFNFDPEPRATYVLLIQTSNYLTTNGVFLYAPALSVNRRVAGALEVEGIYNAIACGVLFALGVYSFMMWYRRREDKPAMALCLLAFICFVRVIGTTPYLRDLCPVSMHNLVFRLEYFSMSTGCLSYLWFLHATFDSSSRSRWYKTLLIIGLILSIPPICLPPVYFTTILNAYQIFGLVCCINYLTIVIRALKAHKSGAAFLCWGVCLAISALVFDVLVAHDVLPRVYILPIGVAVFVLMQTQIIAKRAADAFTQAELYAHELSKSEQERTLFFHNTSHELRTPLNGIIGFVDLLTQERFGVLSDSARAQIAKIGGLAHSLKLQVNTILDLAKSKKGQLGLNNTRFALSELMDHCSNLAEGLIFKHKNANFQVHTSWQSTENPSFINDSQKVLTIIRNLLGNAFKFSHSDQENKVILDLSLIGDTLTIKVSDTGIGIPRHHQDEIFQEFKQLQGDARRAYEGTGLGLAMVRDLVKLMNGKIEVNSADQVGSTFTVTIPAQTTINTVDDNFEDTISRPFMPDGSTKKPTKVADETLASKTGKLVMIVDDNEVNCEIIETILGCEGYQTIVAHGGMDGLAQMRIHHPNLLLLDLMMPEMSGEDVMHEMKQDELLKDIPIILLTARASQEDRIAGLEFGADDYLAKPIISKELLVRIHNLLTRLDLVKLLEASIYDQKMSQLGEMMTDLVHELRNINQSTAGTIELLTPKIRELFVQFKLPEPGWSDIINSLIDGRREPIENSRMYQIYKMIPPEIEDSLSLRKIGDAIADAKCDIGHFMPVWKHLLKCKDKALIAHLECSLDIVVNLLRFARSGIRSNELVSNVLAYGRESKTEDRIQIDELVGKVLTLQRYRLTKAHINLTTELTEHSEISGNFSEIQQILVNLIVNAKDALCEIQQPNRTLSIRSHEDHDKVLLEVADNGVGIKSEHLEQIFDAGFTTKGAAGNGRGLAIAKRLMKKNHGDITVRRTPDETIFTLELRKAA